MLTLSPITRAPKKLKARNHKFIHSWNKRVSKACNHTKTSIIMLSELLLSRFHTLNFLVQELDLWDSDFADYLNTLSHRKSAQEIVVSQSEQLEGVPACQEFIKYGFALFRFNTISPQY